MNQKAIKLYSQRPKMAAFFSARIFPTVKLPAPKLPKAINFYSQRPKMAAFSSPRSVALIVVALGRFRDDKVNIITRAVWQ